MREVPQLFIRAARKILVNPVEALLILRMAVWVSVLSALVKLQSLPRALRFVAGPKDTRTRSSKPDIESRLARAIDLLLGANLFVFKPICWKRAAVLHRYLALNGIETSVVFGLRKEASGVLAGHAWLEAGGRPILEPKIPDYRVTYTFPSPDTSNVDLELFR